MKKYNMNLFLISMSPWPMFMSMILFLMCINFVMFMNSSLSVHTFLSFLLILMVMFSWWSDVSSESTNQGFHNKYVVMMTCSSMIMFILSEVFFFVSFFWTFFNSMLSLEIMTGSSWPMSGIEKVNYLSLPLMNSVLLVSSGCSITWSHYMLINVKLNESKLSLMLTVILGMTFLVCQALEYKFCYFSFSDSIFGSIFFISTGFHGIHVLIGSLFLTIMLIMMNKYHFSANHMMGLEFSIWYWHFVDVVWLYLFMLVYWLGS